MKDGFIYSGTKFNELDYLFINLLPICRLKRTPLALKGTVQVKYMIHDMVFESELKQIIFSKFGTNLKDYDNPEEPRNFRRFYYNSNVIFFHF